MPQVLAQACDLDPSQLLPLPLLRPPQPDAPAEAAGTAPAAAEAQQTQGDGLPQQTLQQHDELHTQLIPTPDPLQELLAGRVRCVEFSGGRVFTDAPRGPGRVYLPGSFNPLHQGHKDMLAAAVEIAAQDWAGAEGCFELAVVNADKVRAAHTVAAAAGSRHQLG